MRILVTGGLGFIGHNIVRILEDQGHELIAVDNQTNYDVLALDEIFNLLKERKTRIKTPFIYTCDINDPKLNQIFERHKPEVVIHAASFPRQALVKKNPTTATRTMIEGLVNTLEISVNVGVKKFVFISSSMVYGNFDDGVKENASCNPIGLYGILKLSGEQIVKEYSKSFDIPYLIIRPSAVYGPRDTNDRVIAKFINLAKNDQILTVNGNNEALDFTYVDDLAAGIAKAATSDVCNETYNLTKGKSHTLYHAAEMVVQMVGKGKIEVKDKDSNWPSRGSLDISKAIKDFNYAPSVHLTEGLERYYAWINNTTFWT